MDIFFLSFSINPIYMFEKGNKLAPGRKKGSTNLSTEQLRQMICQALGEAGGVDYLVGVAKENSSAFCSLIAKVLPKQITGEGGGPIKISVLADALREHMLKK